MEGDSLCLICHSNSSPVVITSYLHNFLPSNPKLLSNDLGTYFLLRHIFKLSAQQLQNYLRNCPCPGEWVKVCCECTEKYVDKCARIFVELLDVQRRLRTVRNEIIEAVKTSVEQEPKFNRADPFTLDITEEVRRFVAQSEIEVEVDRSTGDLKTEEWMKHHANYDCTSSLLVKKDTRDDIKEELPEAISNSQSDAASTDVGFEGEEDVEMLEREEDPDHHEEYLPPSSTREKRGSVVRKEKSKRNPKRKAATPAPSTARRKPKLKGEKKQRIPPNLMCHICSKTLKSRRSLHHHIERHETGSSSRAGQREPPLFHCDQRPSTFTDEKKLSVHQGYHKLAAGAVECSDSDCDFKTRIPSLLTEHKTRYHGTGPEGDFEGLTCPICHKRVAFLSNLVAHASRRHAHTEDSFKCDFCSDLCPDEAVLVAHMAQAHHVTELEKHSCRVEGCGKIFHQKCLLELHEMCHFKVLHCHICKKMSGTLKTFESHLNTHDTPKKTFATFQCSHNLGAFPTMEGLRSHKISKHGSGISLEQDNTSETTFSVKPPIITSDGKIKYPCQQEGCSSTMSNYSSYKLHEDVYHSTKPPSFHTCQHCQKVFDHRSSLYSHVKYTHGLPGEDGSTIQNQCNFCRKVCKNAVKLKLHIETIHLKKFPHYCDVCGKGMVTPLELTHHKVHAHFICATAACTFRGEDLAGIWKHQKEVHETEVGAWACDECGKILKVKTKVGIHKRIHKAEQRQKSGDGEGGGEWICDLCGKQFALKEYLYYHNWHTHQKLRKNKSQRTGEKKAVWVTSGSKVEDGNDKRLSF